ncbi:CDP-alcohol phosphatidyltransferase family protein [Halostreptopolyspora alba]|uniref:CDP-alcohol phosphatidyltransferase family protein n=1 Tax=Halostreptopolyspora alba TaxID=2487137 RepID=A0A3N0EC02_9ACTN|nr:CDP-alcohol phosphatidyltransferase family protein [Nocardiopsaceae bacterium YIM 96095]
MPSIYQLKPAFQGVLRPCVRWLARAGVTANAVTVAAAALSVAVGACVAVWSDHDWPLLLLPAFLFLRMAFNAVDGMLAREHGMESRLGAILNELGDVVSDAALYLPLALVAAFDPRLVVLIVVLAVISEMTGVLGLAFGSRRRYDGPMGKSDRAAVFGALGLWLGLGGTGGAWLSVVLGATALLLAATTVNRARQVLRDGEG